MTRKNKKSTHLYVLSCDGLLKIGVTNDIDKRVKTLQTGNGNPIIVEYLDERLNPEKAEKYLHRCFAKKRRKGEWFENLTLHEIRVKLMLFFDQD